MAKYKNPEKSNGRSQPQILVDFMEGLRQASSAASVLGNVLRNPEYWKISDVLHTVKNLAPNIAVTSLHWGDANVKSYTGVRKATPSVVTKPDASSATPSKLIL